MARKSPARARRRAKKSSAKAASRAPRKKRAAKEADWRIRCASLAEIRANIDRLDAVIAPLVCQRHYFVTEAARFKPSVAGVVVSSRVEEIIATVRAIAQKMKADPRTIETAYRAMIDAFTADEQRHWREIHK